ncbi:MAG TPA: S41 family peptidase [Nannocystis sp.]
MWKIRTVSLLTLTILACDPEPEAAPAVEEAGPTATASAAASAGKAAGPAKALHGEAMPDAEQAFKKAREIILKNYVDPALDEQALYTGAIEGMVARLGSLPEHPINELLSPRELAELMHGTGGTIVGIGVMIEQIADVVVVRDVIAGGPAAKAGLQRGDRLLAIDGVPIKGRPLVEIVDRLRGKAGTEVDLFVQRDTEEWHEKLVRSTVAIPNVESKLVSDGLGYVRLRGFAETTPAEFDAALTALQQGGAKAVVLDLRHCPGGLLEAAVTITGSLLADGQTIVTTSGRDEAPQTRTASGDGRWRALPLAALIGPETASGAEILADALAAHERATLIGAPTLGKGTIESVHELGNGWALKISTGRFIGASGEPLQGRGVRPQVPVPIPKGEEPAPLDAVSPESDAALALARTWLESQLR